MTTWITDAERHSQLSEQNVYVTRSIEAFLSDERLFWIVASKGMGKTLLLRYKRAKMEAEAAGSGIVILPHLKPLDYVRLPTSLPNDSTHSLSDRGHWKDLWQCAITLSILTVFPFGPNDRADVTRIVKTLESQEVLPDHLIQSVIKRINRISGTPEREHLTALNPSDFLVELLQINIGQQLKLRRYCMQTIYNLYASQIRSGVFVFIDSFDQALREAFDNSNERLSIWIEGQLGLLLAAWEMSRHNPHIKIFTSIRQEAFAAFRDESRQAIFGSMLLLKYSREELRQLLNKSVSYFEKKKSLSDLIGLSTVQNQHSAEDVFDFTLRHIIPTPRSFMVAGGEVAQECGGINDAMSIAEKEKRFHAILRNCASEEICEDYLLGEMNLFLPTLKVRRNLDILCRLIQRNVLSRSMAQRIVNQFNELLKAEGVEPGQTVNPMCELHNIGLLGSVNTDPFDGSQRQAFRKPYEFDWQMKDTLPESTFYFLHPSLHRLVSSANPRYRVSRVLIGDDCPWDASHKKILREELFRIFVSYSTMDKGTPEKLIARLGDSVAGRGAFVDFWFDKWKIRGGQWIQVKIEEGIKKCDLMIVLVSKKSLGSRWVETEWRAKFQQEIEDGGVKVLPVLLDEIGNTELPALLRGKLARRIRKAPKSSFENDIRILTDDILGFARDLGKHVGLGSGEDDLE